MGSRVAGHPAGQSPAYRRGPGYHPRGLSGRRGYRAVGAVGRDEAIEILARGTPRGTPELDLALADLAATLFGWALLLTLAAAESTATMTRLGIRRRRNSHPGSTEPTRSLAGSDSPNELSRRPAHARHLKRTPDDATPRSIDVLMRRSLNWLGGPEHQALFELLAIYPPGAAITQPMLEDLWQSPAERDTEENQLLARAGLAQPERGTRPKSNCMTSSPRGCTTNAASPTIPTPAGPPAAWPSYACVATEARVRSPGTARNGLPTTWSPPALGTGSMPCRPSNGAAHS